MFFCSYVAILLSVTTNVRFLIPEIFGSYLYCGIEVLESTCGRVYAYMGTVCFTN